MTTTALKPHALYRFFAADGALLYVGITMDPSRRWNEHRSDKPWWSDVATVSVEKFPSRADVERAERDAIVSENPRHNRAGVPRPMPATRKRPRGRGIYVSSEGVARLLGLSRQRIHQLDKAGEMPEPAARLKMGAVWRIKDVKRWAKERGREIHE